jgi:hypothetical protein
MKVPDLSLNHIKRCGSHRRPLQGLGHPAAERAVPRRPVLALHGAARPGRTHRPCAWRCAVPWCGWKLWPLPQAQPAKHLDLDRVRAPSPFSAPRQLLVGDAIGAGASYALPCLCAPSQAASLSLA